MGPVFILVKLQWPRPFKCFGLLLIGLCVILGSSLSAQAIPRFSLREEPQSLLAFTDSLEAFNSLGAVALSPEQQGQVKALFPDEYYAQPGYRGQWMRLALVNTGLKAQMLYLRFCSKAHAAVVFEIDSQAGPQLILADQAGLFQAQWFPSSAINFPLALDRDQEKQLLVYLVFSQAPKIPQHFNELHIGPLAQLNRDYLRKASTQHLFSGVFLLLSFVAFFFGGLLRKRAFIYFGLTIICLIPYFLFLQNQSHLLVGPLQQWRPSFDWLNAVILLLVLFSSLFIDSYLELKRQRPKYRMAFALIAALVLALITAHLWQGQLLYWLNPALALWLLSILGFTAEMAYRSLPGARSLFWALLLLLTSAFFYALQQAGIWGASLSVNNLYQVGALLFSSVLFYDLAHRVLLLRREKERVESLSKVKTRFFEDVSHELRTPLTLIEDPLKRLLEQDSAAENRPLMLTAYRSAQGLRSLVDEILELARLEAVPQSLSLERGDIIAPLKACLGAFESSAAEKSIRLHFISSFDYLAIDHDPNRWQKIFTNLIANALKFSPPGKNIFLEVRKELGKLNIVVRDEGPGIAAEQIPFIFERFYQVSVEQSKPAVGSGIGLALVKEWVNLHQGKISVDSKLGKGSRFSLYFPLSPELADASKVQVTEHDLELLARGPKKSLLIVEDHPELRAYLVDLLSPHYEVWQAKDGEEGLSMALEKLPVLVLCDLMMPGKNGFELTQNLKTNPSTSHILVVLLTARSGQKERYEGLESGADAYIVKPFDSHELILTIRNQIEQREKLWQRMAEGGLPISKEEGLSKADRNFLERIENCLALSYQESSFRVEELAQSCAMSQTHLNRKLQALTGQSASKVIRNYRLTKAREMIQQKQGNVSQIAIDCGFNSPAYFVKCYKEKYAQTPGAEMQ